MGSEKYRQEEAQWKDNQTDRHTDMKAFIFLSSHLIQPLSHNLDTVNVWVPAKPKDRDPEQVKLICHWLWLSGTIVKSLSDYVLAMQSCWGKKGGFMVKGAYLSNWSAGIKCCRWQRLTTVMLFQHWASKHLLSPSPYSFSTFIFNKPWELPTALESKWNASSRQL